MHSNGNENWNYTDNNYNNNSRAFVRVVSSLCYVIKMVKEFDIEYVSYEELYNAYIDCRKKKRRGRSAINFEIEWQANLYSLYCQLNSKTYKINPYIVFCVDKPVKREVFAADFSDRIVHHLIINRLNNALEKEFIDDSYSCREGKGTQYGVLRCKKQIEECTSNYTEEAWILKGDFKSFFMTIDLDLLYSKLEKFVYEKVYNEDDMKANYTCWLIHTVLFAHPENNCIKIQDNKKWKGLPLDKSLFNCPDGFGLPIGNLTSQIFANFYLSEFDHWMKDTLQIKFYGRYVDDFYIIHKDKDYLKRLIRLIKTHLEPLNVQLHPNKIYIQKVEKGITFVGTIIKPNRMYVSNRLKQNAFDKINSIKSIDDNWEHYMCVFNSYLGFMKEKATYKIRKKLCKQIEAKTNKKLLSINKFQKIFKA